MKKISPALLLMTVLVLFALLGAFARTMTTLNHNENMYIAASILVRQNNILYRDFGFEQTPYLPILYGMLFRLLNLGSYYLLTGKVVSFLSLFAAGMALYLIARRVLKDTALSLGVVTLFFLNTNIVVPSGQVSNYVLPLTLSLAGFYLFEKSFDGNDSKPFAIAVAGLLLAIAAGIRLMYAAVILPFIAVILFYWLMSRHSSMAPKRNFLHVLLPFTAGLAIGLLPMVFFLSDLQSFVFNNLTSHFVNGYWSQIAGVSRNISLLSKMGYARDIFFQPANLILIMGILVAVGLSISSFRINRQAIEEMPKGAFLAFLLFAIAVPTTLAPTPSWPEYYAMPVSFLFLVLVYSCASKSPDISILHGRLLLILVLVSLVYSGPSLVKSIYDLRDGNNWAGLMVHDVSVNIRDALHNYGNGQNEKIATLSPLYVLDADLPIYLELATGPFTYRVGDLLTPEQREHYVVTSPKTIGNLLDENPPAAILVGFEGDLDGPLVDYALAHNYRKVDGFFGGGELYLPDIDKP